MTFASISHARALRSSKEQRIIELLEAKAAKCRASGQHEGAIHLEVFAEGLGKGLIL